MSLWPNLPYELFGKVSFALITSFLVGILIGIAIFLFAFIWIRGWAFISNSMWKGYEPHENRPPLWKMRISGVTLALSRREFKKIPAVYREADDLADDEITARKAMVQYLKKAFIDD